MPQMIPCNYFFPINRAAPDTDFTAKTGMINIGYSVNNSVLVTLPKITKDGEVCIVKQGDSNITSSSNLFITTTIASGDFLDDGIVRGYTLDDAFFFNSFPTVVLVADLTLKRWYRIADIYGMVL
jgi:hypothetical protein